MKQPTNTLLNSLRNELCVGPLGKPPVGGNARTVPLWTKFCVRGSFRHLVPRGMSNDLNHSVVAVTLYC